MISRIHCFVAATCLTFTGMVNADPLSASQIREARKILKKQIITNIDMDLRSLKTSWELSDESTEIGGSIHRGARDASQDFFEAGVDGIVSLTGTYGLGLLAAFPIAIPAFLIAAPIGGVVGGVKGIVYRIQERKERKKAKKTTLMLITHMSTIYKQASFKISRRLGVSSQTANELIDRVIQENLEQQTRLLVGVRDLVAKHHQLTPARAKTIALILSLWSSKAHAQMDMWTKISRFARKYQVSTYLAGLVSYLLHHHSSAS